MTQYGSAGLGENLRAKRVGLVNARKGRRLKEGADVVLILAKFLAKLSQGPRDCHDVLP